MKKITLFLFSILLLCSPLFAKIVVDGTMVNGMYRGTVRDRNHLPAMTNAFRGDIYGVLNALSNYPAGLYVSKVNHPMKATNWILSFEMVGTNVSRLIPFNSFHLTNIVWSAMTNDLHVAVSKEIQTATNKASTLLNANITSSSSVLHSAVRTSITATSNSALKLIMTNSYSRGIFSHSTNVSHSLFTNVLNVRHTNQIMLIDSKHVKWRLVVDTNGSISTTTNK